MKELIKTPHLLFAVILSCAWIPISMLNYKWTGAPYFAMLAWGSWMAWKQKQSLTIGHLACVIIPTLGILLSPFSLDTNESFISAVKMFFSLGVGGLLVSSAKNLDDKSRKFIMNGAYCGVWIVLVAFGILQFMHADKVNSQIISLSPLAAILSLVFWGLAEALYGESNTWQVNVLRMSILIGLVFILFELSGTTAKIAFLAGCLTWILANVHARLVIRLISITATVITLATPSIFSKYMNVENLYAVSPEIKLSLYHRMYFWQMFAEEIKEGSNLGHGFNITRKIFSSDEGKQKWEEYVNNHIHHSHENNAGFLIAPVHPHNGFLQIWYELSYLGAFAAIFIFFWISNLILRLPKRSQPFAAALYTSILITINASYSLWQSMWTAIMMFSIFLYTVVAYETKKV